MRRILGWLSGRQKTTPVAFQSPLAPDQPLAVIGDVHGRDDLLEPLVAEVASRAPDAQVILVGDLIDRGERSAEVLRRVAEHGDWLCLRGNHETMCLEFLDDPERFGPRWLTNGGLQTLASFGVGGVNERSRGGALVQARDQLEGAMGSELISWLRRRPLIWRSGNVAVVHAAADPGRPIEGQEEQALVWGHPRFAEEPRRDGVWIVHGHTILPWPAAADGRIGVDTGAYATGRLTVALIRPDHIEFIST